MQGTPSVCLWPLRGILRRRQPRALRQALRGEGAGEGRKAQQRQGQAKGGALRDAGLTKLEIFHGDFMVI